MMRIAGRVFAALVVFGARRPRRSPADDRRRTRSSRRSRPESARLQPKAGEDQQKPSQAYMAEAKVQKKAELIGELAKADPDNARLVKLLPQRWMRLAQSGKVAEARPEIDETLAKTKDEGLKTEALFSKSQILMAEEPGRTLGGRDADRRGVPQARPQGRRSPVLLDGPRRPPRTTAKKTRPRGAHPQGLPREPTPAEQIKGAAQAEARRSASRSSWSSPTRSRARRSR